MKKGEVEPRLRLDGWDMVIAQARHSRWVKKQSAMRFKCERFCAGDDHLGCAILVRNVDGARTVLVMQPRVGAHQLPSLLSFGSLALPSSPATFASEDDRGDERECCQETSRPCRVTQLGTDLLVIFVKECSDGLLGSRGA